MSEVNLDPAAQAILAKLAIDLANNPETRKDFARITKKVDPSRRFHDVEADDLEARVNARFEEEKQAREAEKATKKMERAKMKLAERYDEDAIKEIEGLMEKHGLADYELAARLYAADTKAATPHSPQEDYSWKLPNIDVKDFNNLKQISRDRAYQALDDLKRKRA